MERVRPYAHAPRLSADDAAKVDPRTLVTGDELELEIGPGRGGFLQERALAAPRAGLIGLEIRRKWATIVDDRLRAAGLGGRARVFAEDARWAMRRIEPQSIFVRIFMHFPDPWWKKRHTKRLVMGDVFLEETARLLAMGGELFVQTDVEERAELYRAQIARSPSFEPFGDESTSPWLRENPYGARSPREARAIRDGLPIFRLRYRKKA